MTADTGRGDAPTGTDDDEADDEALSWGESSDKSYVEGPVVEVPVELRDAEDDEADGEDDEPPEGVMSSGALVAHGVFAAVLLLYTVAWLVSVTRATAPSLAGVALLLWHVGQVLAVAAPAAWFVATVALTPLRPGRKRYLWLLVGVLVLIPWQFIVGGSV
ncbi:hypothetical protein AX769_15660 [Frondihabitans sp. PAMC 28766]|uniref:hypothetical protein n=1 Tax=Frondihabitans sp. PAMC 28766 TaxID=1795630 RepID=UPI00078BC33A|nr:hypothetical protein [Frondihabitans sp. PAMC 28766]AMM21302.1 hypothetical protein AX769_15660 [Frondihabitans sp. PAMC 28766]